MVNIYNFLKNVLQDIKNESNSNFAFPFVLLLLITIPFPYFINNIALVLFVLFSIIKLKKNNITFSIPLFLPILVFVLMLLSYFWSIDTTRTLNAIPKEISLFLIPLGFMVLPKFTLAQKDKIIKYFSYSIVILVAFFLLRATIRYFLYHDFRVFFYHDESENDFGLVPKLLNAIHVSVFVAIAFFYFFIKEKKTFYDTFISFLLFGFIVLLSSKNIILVIILLLLIHFFFVSKTAHKMRLRNLIVVGIIIGLFFYFGKIKERFQIEIQTNTEKSISDNVIKDLPQEVHNVSIKEAWTNESFTPNDFFPGTAFRVYQARMFFEIIKEKGVFFSGLGLNASQPKLVELGKKYNVFLGNESQEGYQTKNFHNQYIQNYADLGFVGFLLLLLLLGLNLKNAIKTKDFIHISFAILMISLFLTESFLWRQRGVVFFTLMYCVFNAKNQENTAKNQ